MDMRIKQLQGCRKMALTALRLLAVLLGTVFVGAPCQRHFATVLKLNRMCTELFYPASLCRRLFILVWQNSPPQLYYRETVQSDFQGRWPIASSSSHHRFAAWLRQRPDPVRYIAHPRAL